MFPSIPSILPSIFWHFVWQRNQPGLWWHFGWTRDQVSQHPSEIHFGYVKQWFLKYYNQYTWVGFHPLYKPNQQKRFWIICSPDSSIFFLPPRYSDAVKKGFALVAGIVCLTALKIKRIQNALNERCGKVLKQQHHIFFQFCWFCKPASGAVLLPY